jgi:hypothetical protein
MLPKIDVPIYDLTLVSNDKKIRFRPFTVKEEKLFLMAMESPESDEASYLNTIKQVLNNCIIDEIDIETIPTFDLEYLLLNLRAKSVGEEITLKYKCNNDIEKEDKKDKCNNIVEMTFNILEAKPEKQENHSNKIEINEKLGLVMKYPTFGLLQNYDGKNNTKILIDTIVECIDYIYDENNIYYAKDSSKEELIEFLDSLQTKDLEKIKDFFETMPKLSKNLNFKCKKCGYEESINVEGIQSFFG